MIIGNRTEWSPIRSVIILGIKQIGLPLHGRPILLTTRMITDRIGLHSVLLPLLIILVIKQIGLPLRGRPILLITRMITDRIGLHSVLLPLRINSFLLL